MEDNRDAECDRPKIFIKVWRYTAIGTVQEQGQYLGLVPDRLDDSSDLVSRCSLLTSNTAGLKVALHLPIAAGSPRQIIYRAPTPKVSEE